MIGDRSYPIDAPSAAYPGSESVIQTLFRARARIMCPGVLIVAIPNAGKRSVYSGAKMQREGMAAGFPDVMCIWPMHTAYIEFKNKSGHLSEAQREWLDRLSRYGFPVMVARHPDTALEFLRSCSAPFSDRKSL